ncbi:MAG: helix-turn-helix transcriptional regulator [Ekhidna sp.]
MIYTFKDFDCVEYLRNFAANKIRKRFDLSTSRALNVLAKSLLYIDYGDLIDDIKNVEEEYESRNGCFFSEFVLADELKIDISEAYSLKKELDNHHFYGSGISHGNIEVTNLSNVSSYSLNISLGKETRLMFSYPIDFYSRIYDQSFRLDSDTYSIEALWCDGFSFLHPSYFLTLENMKLYMEAIFESLLSYNDLVVSYSQFDNWIKHDPITYNFIKYNFENYPVYNGTVEESPYGLFFPSGPKKSLRKRLGYKSPLLSTQTSESLKTKIELVDRGDVFKKAREKQCMTKTRLAKLCHLSVRTIYNVENEKCSHYTDTIRKLASVLKLDISSFLPIES